MTKPLKISSIRRKYKDEWVVVEVTKNENFTVPVAGKVIVHGKERKSVYDQGFQILRQNPEKDLYFFFTGEPVPEGMGVVLGAV
ncbi:MAG: hypothetical protein ONB44_12060 [candidate division KSB1 bacterium]|nr:hypothetical protein [candidate division KSB1 bacterium]MDZ7302854.1 hypothetical protein [candidate division KSB1 bacterium]MDZ7311871.1 hypothetical protein [candidate division KSB1 bacterium]